MHHVTVKKPHVHRLQNGYPWAYTHMLSAVADIPAGALVTLNDHHKKPFAIGYYNPFSKVACRILTLDLNTQMNEAYFYQRFEQALHKRNERIKVPYYRLVHAEGDNLPGLVIDRFGDTLVCQTTTAGMEKLKPIWLNALEKLLSPARMILRDDVCSRTHEGLDLNVSCYKGDACETISLIENDCTFYANPITGQKTGWFYDQRANRLWVSKQVNKKTVLDLYCYHGGFGVLAAKRGAKQVTLVDSSEKALAFAKQAAQANDVLSKCEFLNESIFELLTTYQGAGIQFDVIVADPPAFVKQVNHKGAGLRGYQKLAKLASGIVAQNGILFMASCSHHASTTEFRNAVETGIQKAQRNFSFLYKMGADKDHPIHPFLPENHYLKALAYRLE